MITLLGPTYRYQGEILQQPEVIYVDDHQFDEEQQCFHIKKLLDASPVKHLLIFDHDGHEDILQDYPHVCMPTCLASEVEQFIAQDIDINWTQKTKTFNFMINKPRLHREFLLSMIEYFELSNYSYSLPWRNAEVGHRLANPAYNHILETTLQIQPTNYVFGPEVALDRGVKNGSYKNAETYDKLLKTTVFEPSCISLITEPCFYEREIIVTEKTVMSMYAGTLPIWVGGWRIADCMKNSGFDVFDDVIDHSYQSLEDPWDRCYHAIADNIELLKNFEQANKFINDNQHRLQHNLNLIKENVFLQQIKNTIQQQPALTQRDLLTVARRWKLPV
jgi:hypothetical protein